MISEWQYFLTIVIMAGSFIILGLGTFFIIFMTRKIYKHTVVIEEVFGNSKRTIVKWAKEKIAPKSKIKTWRLWWEGDSLKRDIPLPKNDVIDIDKKGRLVVHAVRLESGDIVYFKNAPKVGIRPTDLYTNVPPDILNIQDHKERSEKYEAWKRSKYSEWQEKNGVDIEILTFTPNQRLVMIENYRKAIERRRKNFMEILPLIVGGTVFILAMVVILVFVFQFKEFTQPGLEAQKTEASRQEIYLEMAKTLEKINSNVQELEADEGNS